MSHISAPRPLSRLRRWWNDIRFGQLLGLLLVGLLLAPLRSHHTTLYLVFQFMLLNALVVALSAVRGHRPVLRFVILGLWAVGAILKTVHFALGGQLTQHHLLITTGALDALLLWLMTYVVIRTVLKSREVTSETIYASIVAYLLIAIAFACLYDLALVVSPHAFEVAGGMPGESAHVRNAMVYFSFVTITTLGYGDVTPVLPVIRMLCVIEAVVGQFYIAVVIAWLVSTYASNRKSA